MKSLVSMAVFAAFGVLAAPAAAQTVHARLHGYNEVPSVASVGTGQFKAKIDEAAGTIFWELEYSGMQADVAQAHIHLGQRHTNGSITVFLCSNLGNGPAGTQPCPARSASLNGSAAAAQVLATAATQQLPAGGFEQLVKAIRSGATYANVHTAVSPGGEIRGQIRGDDDNGGNNED